MLIWLIMICFEFLPCCILIFCFVSMLCVVCKHDRASRTLAKQLRFNHRVLFKSQQWSAVEVMAIVISLLLQCYGFFMRCSFVVLINDLKPCNDQEYKIPLVVLTPPYERHKEGDQTTSTLQKNCLLA